MAVNWTDEQKQVIRTRGRNILVSAAAGSGKTAVLVERILARIRDEEDPVDIDQMLIVTFTKAAAGEMRERLVRSLADAREQQPENAHLARQTALVPGALITTIDGFCAYVIRNYGYLAGMTPGRRVAESGEAELMKQDALREILEEAYAEESDGWQERMTEFAETFALGKSERQLEESILRVAEAADSVPDPEAWIRSCMPEEGLCTKEALFQTKWMQDLMADAAEEAAAGYRCAMKNLALTEQPDGPVAYRPSAEADAAAYEALMVPFREAEKAQAFGAEHYDACRAALTGYQPVKLSNKKKAPEEDPSKRELFKAERGELQSILKKLLNEYFSSDAEEAAAFYGKSCGPVRTLLVLAARFRARYAELKEKKHVMDFADLEHGALRILRGEGGRTYAAKELAGRFREVMIDEYQDSNYLQEAILTAVSRNEDGEQNYFAVGDVKQSIYSFRQARPELFMEKYGRYAKDGAEDGEGKGDGVRIDLHRNFRSRREVVDAVNGIFGQIMRREIGGVEYDEDAALVQGASYPPAEGMEAEVLAVLTGEKDDEGEALAGKMTAAESRRMEARAIGGRIRELMAGNGIYDAKLGAVRPVRYSDIVILLRTMEGWAEPFAEVLESMRIPAWSTAGSGYFAAPEVVTVLHYLSVLDNPEQDIPFASVLTSAFASLTAEELTKIRTADLAVSLSGSRRREDISLYGAARAYAEADPGDEPSGPVTDAALRSRLQDFFALYDSFRGKVPDTPLHELVDAILTESGFLDYASALPGGAQRALNLRMLADKAAEYEQTSYIGLFNFIRYIENLRKYSQDFGEQSVLSEQADVVRIYSIHKSKGLEYPIVFVAGGSKSFNLQDLNAPVLIHPDLGAASDCVDYVRRVKAPTLMRQAIRRRLLKDHIGEELRVLYVALTRAQQKLIITGTAQDEEKIGSLSLLISDEEQKLPAGYISGCKDYLHWVIPAAKRLNERRVRIGLPEAIPVRFIKPSELSVEEVRSKIRREDVLAALRELSPEHVYDERMHRAIGERFSFRYPHEGGQIPVEVSVSELKMEAIHGARSPLREMEEGSGAEEPAALFETEKEAPLVPAFYREMHPAAAEKEEEGKTPASPSAMTGAMRGTAYHRVMELLCLKKLRGLSGDALSGEVQAQMEEMQRSGRMTEEEIRAVKCGDIAAFVSGPLGQRMTDADARGCLYREQPFVLGMDAAEIHAEWPEGETVFVQGIIDAFFYEEKDAEAKDCPGKDPGTEGKRENAIVLVDYKTDSVRSAEELAERYRVQLDSYAAALERVTGCPVKEKLIWSFSLKQVIFC